MLNAKGSSLMNILDVKMIFGRKFCPFFPQISVSGLAVNTNFNCSNLKPHVCVILSLLGDHMALASAKLVLLIIT